MASHRTSLRTLVTATAVAAAEAATAARLEAAVNDWTSVMAASCISSAYASASRRPLSASSSSNGCACRDTTGYHAL